MRLLLLATAAVLGTVCPGPAQVIDSKLSGTIGLDWASYRHEDGGDDVDGSHFFQQYSLLYKSKGVINSGRAGKWDVALGYEWNDLSSELDDISYDETTDKILFQGDILFAPGGLPLRVHAFSYDMHQSLPYSDTRGDFGALIDPGIFTTIENGQHISTGITLLAGIKNGSYLGEYRELLSQFPKLLIDFREELVRDTERRDQVHYRMRDLAFVSLNKKDNWFHYRHQDFKDYEDPNNDYTQKTFLLGTIDHMERRQWINLTNWIKISTDVSLTQYEETLRPWEQEDTYAFNLFSLARRSNYEVSNPASFRRSARDTKVESSLYFPVFASGALDSQSLWRLMLVGNREEDEYFASGTSDRFGTADRSEDTLYGRFQFETTRYAGYVLTPEIALETNKTSDEKGNAARVGFEMRTNDVYRKSVDWLVSYDLTWIDGEDKEDDTVSYWGHELLASLKHRASSGTTMGVTQGVLFGYGDKDRLATTYITQRSLNLDGQATAPLEESSDDSYLGSYTTAFLELSGNRPMLNRFEAVLIYEKEDSTEEHLLELRHLLTSNRPKSTLRMESVFRTGDDIKSSLNTNNVSDPWGSLRDVDMTFSHSTEMSYRPNRAWEARGTATADWISGAGDDAYVFSVEQETRYSLYQMGGLSRKILEAYQLFDYEHTWGPSTSWYSKLELGIDWSPFRRVLFGGNVTLEYYDLYEQTEIGYELYAAVDYQKFRAKTAYEYRQLDYDDDSSTPKVKDSRVSVSVQKIF